MLDLSPGKQAGAAPDKTVARANPALKKVYTKGGQQWTKYTPETVKLLLKCVRDGLTLKQSAIACGIGESTLQLWRNTHPELVPKLEQAREKARQDALAVIWAERGNDWRAAESFLRYSFWQDYRPGAQVSVSTSLNQQTAIVATEADRERLVRLRESIMSPQIKHAEVIEDATSPPRRKQSDRPGTGRIRLNPGSFRQHTDNCGLSHRVKQWFQQPLRNGKVGTPATEESNKRT